MDTVKMNPGTSPEVLDRPAGVLSRGNKQRLTLARALMHGRSHATVQDVQKLAPPVLRHRILLNYRAEAEGVRIEDVIHRLIESAAA